MKISRYTFVLFLVILTGCVTAKEGNFEETNIHIISVETSLHPEAHSTPTFQEKFKAALENYAVAFNRIQSGSIKGYALRVQVTGIHYKNAVASLLVGDTNSISSASEIYDPETGQVLRSFKSTFVDGAGAILNGVSGALLAATVAKERADETLIRGLSANVMKGAFATKHVPAQSASFLKDKNLFLPPTMPLSPMSPQVIESEASGVEEVLDVSSGAS